MIELVHKLEADYPWISKERMLARLDTTWGSFQHLCRTVRDHRRRESAIPEEDVAALVEQIIAMPFLGGRKGSLKLVEDQKALIGQTMYKDAKGVLRKEAEKELAKRREQSELERNRRDREQAEDGFVKPVISKPHQMWSIDFTEVKLLGIRFMVCVIYDIFAQAYLALRAAEVADGQLTMDTVEEACAYAGTTPSECLLSDNGGQFESMNYNDLLDRLRIQTLKTPPGQPWYNGELESGNRDLKKVIWTEALYGACEHPEITRPGVSREKIGSYLQQCCQAAKEKINGQIPRPKFDTVPRAVLDGKQSEMAKRRDQFREAKQEQRRERMETIKAKGQDRRGEPLEDKVKSRWRSIARQMSTEKLFAFNELIHERYDAIAA